MRKLFLLPINNYYSIIDFNRLLKYVSDEKAVYLKQLNNNIDKKLGLYAHLAVKLIIQKYYGIDINNILIMYDDLGKPYIEGQNIFFNISHTRSINAIAFSDNKVGVDIEKRNENSLKIAKRFFTKEEYEFIKNKSNDPIQASVEVWAKKESFLKCLGVGLRKPLNEFCVFNSNFINQFFIIQFEDCVVSYYDGNGNKGIEIVKLTEEEIRKSELFL